MSDDLAWLRDMLQAANEALLLTEGCDLPIFESNREKQLAVTHLLVIVGEAAAQVSEATRLEFPLLPWRLIVGMRNKLVHHYFGARIELVWDVVEHHLEPLIREIEGYLEERPPSAI